MDLDPALPPRVAYAGAWHPVLAVRTHARLVDLDYDFARLGALMAHRDWTTVLLLWRETPTLFHARNPFPPGGYLREGGLVEVPASVTVRQGADMGRPSLLRVDIPSAPDQGIDVTGSAVAMP